MKLCGKCGFQKPLDQFYRNKVKPDGRQSLCKTCQGLAVKSYQLRHPDRVRQNGQTWAEQNDNKVKASGRRYKFVQRLKKYGLSREEYWEMMDRCDGKCMICRQKPGRTMHIDHCHKSGRVRGLLCDACNTGLGSFRDDPTRLAAAIQYLTHAACRSA